MAEVEPRSPRAIRSASRSSSDRRRFGRRLPEVGETHRLMVHPTRERRPPREPQGTSPGSHRPESDGPAARVAVAPQLLPGVVSRGTGRRDAGAVPHLRLGAPQAQPAVELPPRGLGQSLRAVDRAAVPATDPPRHRADIGHRPHRNPGRSITPRSSSSWSPSKRWPGRLATRSTSSTPCSPRWRCSAFWPVESASRWARCSTPTRTAPPPPSKRWPRGSAPTSTKRSTEERLACSTRHSSGPASTTAAPNGTTASVGHTIWPSSSAWPIRRSWSSTSAATTPMPNASSTIPCRS